MNEIWYGYAKLIYGEKVILWYMDTHSFIVYIKTEEIYSDNEKNVKAKFNISNNEFYWPKRKNKKVIGLIER